jgi:hypothetical protein
MILSSIVPAACARAAAVLALSAPPVSLFFGPVANSLFDRRRARAAAMPTNGQMINRLTPQHYPPSGRGRPQPT